MNYEKRPDQPCEHEAGKCQNLAAQPYRYCAVHGGKNGMR